MTIIKTRVSQAQKKAEPLRPLEQKTARQPERAPVQSATPQTAYHRVQMNFNGLVAADLQVLQRTMGNREVQRVLAQHSATANNRLLQTQKKDPSGAEQKRAEELKANYEAAVLEAATQPEKWAEAAVLLNGFTTADILDMLRKLTPEQWKAMFNATPAWVTRVADPLHKLLAVTGPLEEKQFKEIKAESLKEEQARVKQLTADYQKAVTAQDWGQAAVLLNGFSDKDLHALLKKLSKSQRVAMYYTAPASVLRVKQVIADLDKIGKAAAMDDKVFEQIKQLYPDGVTVAIYANYKVGVSGAAEFKRAGEEFAKNQNAIALNGDTVVVGGATPINDLSAVTIAVQRIHQGLAEKQRQSQPQLDATAPLPNFTRIKNLALFAHGEPFGVGLDRSNRFELQLKNVKTFVSGLKSAITDDSNVQLFACSTAADRALLKAKGKDAASYLEWTEHKQHERAGADSFAAALATELGAESTVVGHTTVGHTTENYAARVFGKGAGGGEGGLHIFDRMYSETFIQAELTRLFPDKTDGERAGLHDSLREQMWAHFKDSIMSEHKRKPKDRRYTLPMGQEMFISPGNAETLLHEDWQNNWIPDRLKQVKASKPKAK